MRILIVLVALAAGYLVLAAVGLKKFNDLTGNLMTELESGLFKSPGKEHEKVFKGRPFQDRLEYEQWNRRQSQTVSQEESEKKMMDEAGYGR